jgi:hypothetical protein
MIYGTDECSQFLKNGSIFKQNSLKRIPAGACTIKLSAVVNRAEKIASDKHSIKQCDIKFFVVKAPEPNVIKFFCP